MKIFFGIKFFKDYRNKDIIDMVITELEKLGCSPVCIAKDYEDWGKTRFNPEQLMEIALGEIESSDLVLVESTIQAVGVGIEAGYAYARKIPVVTIVSDGINFPSTLKGISYAIYAYKSNVDLSVFLQKTLTELKSD